MTRQYARVNADNIAKWTELSLMFKGDVQQIAALTGYGEPSVRRWLKIADAHTKQILAETDVNATEPVSE